MKYRAVLYNVNSGADKIESIWVDDYREAKRMGESGLSFYGGDYFDIENSDDNSMTPEETVKELEKQIKRYEYALKNIAYSNFKGGSFEKMAREFAKEELEK